MARKNNGPYLKTNNAGLWEIRWTEGGRSRRKSTGTDDHQKAALALADFLRTGGLPTGENRDLTVREALDLYWHRHVVHHVTDQVRISYVHRWLDGGLGKVKCKDLDDSHIIRYTKDRMSGKLGQMAQIGTVWRELAGLKTALNYAVRQRVLPPDLNPIFTMPEPPKRRERWLNEPQVSALLKAMLELEYGQRASRAHRFIVFALATGARKRAIEVLRWSQVDLEKLLVRYDLQVDVETRKRRAAAPMPTWALDYIKLFEKQRVAVCHGAVTDFVLDDSTEIRHCFEAMMNRVAKHTGDDVYLMVTPHVLRHTTATLMLRAGASLWQVAGLLGDTPDTVARVYGHHAQDHVREGVNLWRPL
jgi:integrase